MLPCSATKSKEYNLQMEVRGQEITSICLMNVEDDGSIVGTVVNEMGVKAFDFTYANGKAKGGPGNLSTENGNYTYEANGKVGTWSGSSTSIEFSVDSQCQINSFTVTYE